ncbi:MAG: GPW/gp25 family protein [candidate division KSB1 bacterium]
MAREFLGVGWKFPVGVDRLGNIALSRHEEDIKEAMCIILGTAKGERMMRPTFGCGIHDLVFAPINTATIAQVEQDVREALILWEPRIDMLLVEVSRDPKEIALGRLLISIDYRVRATNTQFNLVYPFYLTEGLG